MRGKFYWLCWLMLSQANAYAQSSFTKDTTALYRLLDAASVIMQTEPDSAIGLAKNALAIAKRAHYERGIAFCYEAIGHCYGAKKQYQEAEKSYQMAYDIWAKLQEKAGEADMLSRLAGVAFAYADYEKSYLLGKKILQIDARSPNLHMEAYMHMGNAKTAQGEYSSALASFRRALEIAERVGDEYSIAALANNIAIVCDNSNMDEAALEYYLKASAGAKKIGDMNTLATTINNAGVVYKKMRAYGKALQHYEEALKIREQIKDKQGISSTLNNIGILYSVQGDFQKASEYYEKALKIKQEINDKVGIVHSFINVAVLALTTKQFDKCLEYAHQALELATALKVFVQQSEASNILYRAYKAKGDVGKALEYFELHKNTTDSLFTVEKSKAIANLEARAALERKEQQLLNVSKDNELNQRKLEIAEKRAEADRLFALAKQEKDKRKADSLTALATKHQLEADKLSAEHRRTKAEKKAYKAESEQQKKVSEIRKNMLIVSLVSLGAVLVLLYLISRSRQAQKRLNGELKHTQGALISQRDFIEEQNRILASKNYQITQSITTALAIQTALLPFEQHIRKILKDFFVLYQPRDIVSGDFYWIERVGKEVIIAAGDCTGHGVPGAFMSLIALNTLERVVLQQDIVAPAEILRHMHKLIYHLLKQDESDEQSGVDMGIVKIGEAGEICFAGAKRPLYYIDAASPTQIHKQAGARKSIGGMQNESRDFGEILLHLSEGSTFYLSSDGLADQNNAKRQRLREEPVWEALLGAYPLAMEAQKSAVQHLLNEHMKGTDQRDDILLVGVKL